MAQSQVAVVTGTSTGFGHDTARLLVEAGNIVFGTMRDIAGRNAEPAKALGRLGITVVELDVTDDSSVERGTATILDTAGRVDVLVNNAGVAHFGITEAFTPASLERQLATNAVGPFRVARAFLPGMRERRAGLVVFVSSVSGRFITPFTGLYSSSKWATEALAEAFSYELRPFGVDIAIVEPGEYATNLGNAFVKPDDVERLATYGEIAKSGDNITAELTSRMRPSIEVAEAIAALVAAKPGTRPLRTVVPADSPVTHINELVAPIQRSMLEDYGLGMFLTPTPSGVASS